MMAKHHSMTMRTIAPVPTDLRWRRGVDVDVHPPPLRGPAGSNLFPLWTRDAGDVIAFL